MAMGRVREHEVGGGARLLATALSSGVLLVGILGWMVAVGTMASPGGRFGENVLAPSAAYPSLGAAASDAGAYGSRAGEGAVGGSVSYTHLRAHETGAYLVCRLLLEKKKK